MSEIALLLFKYFTAALSVGIAFAGSWFFEYTKQDKTTGKRTLTSAGRWGVVLTLISLGCAGLLSVWTDYQNARTQEKKNTEIAKEKRQATEWRDKTVVLQQQTVALQKEAQKLGLENREYSKRSTEYLAILVENKDKLSPESQRKVKELVQGVKTTDDIRTQYPALYKELTSQQTFSGVVGAFNEAYKQNLNDRISGCGPEVRLLEFAPGFQKGQQFLISDQLALTFTVDPTGVVLILDSRDANKPIDLSDGYSFVFSDAESPKLGCGKSKDKTSCKDAIGESELTAYKLLQTKPLTEIKIKSEKYPASPALAGTILRTFACVKP